MNLLRNASDLQARDEVDESLEVDGTSLEESRSHEDGRTPRAKPKHSIDDTKTSKRSLTCLTSNDVGCHQNILEYTRHRLNKSSSAPQKLTHTVRRPHIVIPCHTNVECTFCQLYDEGSSHDESSEPGDDDKIETRQLKEDEKLVTQKQPSKFEAAKIIAMLKENEKKRKANRDDLTHKHETQEHSGSVLPQVTGTVARLQNTATNNSTDFLEAYSRRTHPRYSRLATTHVDKSAKARCSLTEESDGILPKIYKLRYTKSSHLARPNYNSLGEIE